MELAAHHADRPLACHHRQVPRGGMVVIFSMLVALLFDRGGDEFPRQTRTTESSWRDSWPLSWSASAFLAISSAVSAFTRSQIVALLISIFICLVLYLGGWPPIANSLPTLKGARPWFSGPS